MTLKLRDFWPHVVAGSLAITLVTATDSSQAATSKKGVRKPYAKPTATQRAKAMPAAKKSKIVTITSEHDLDACSLYAVDNISGQSLKEQNADALLPMASWSKIVTGAVMIDEWDNIPDQIPMPLPKGISSARAAHVQLCEADPQTNDPDQAQSVSKYDVLKAMLIPSHNLAARKGGRAGVLAGRYPDFTTAARDVIVKMNLNPDDLIIRNNDMDGIQSARSCNAKGTPLDQRGNLASPRFVTNLWNKFLDKLKTVSSALVDSLTDPNVTILGSTFNNTNPNIATNPDYLFQTKTGSVDGIANLTGRITNKIDGRSISFSAVCPTNDLRRKVGPYLIKYAFPLAAMPSAPASAAQPDPSFSPSKNEELENAPTEAAQTSLLDNTP